MPGEHDTTPAPASRKPISKRLRFEIFKRDGFRCLYCGATPLQSPLHIDHVEALANGGTDDPANLVTACAACNLGKGAVPLDDRPLSVPEDQVEQPDQIRAYLGYQRELMKAKAAVAEALADHWRSCCGYEPTVELLASFGRWADKFGFEKIAEAISITGGRSLPPYAGFTEEQNQQRYFFGIIRRLNREGVR